MSHHAPRTSTRRTSRMRRTSTAVVAAPLLAGLSLAAAGPAAAAEESATVSVLHAVPGLTVDVYADGKELIPDFEPGTLTDPLTLPEGSYDIEVFADGDGPDGTPAISKENVAVPGGANATLVAHLTAAGKPTLTAFVNDTSAVDAGKARVTVRHTAAAPAVDVRADGAAVVEGLTNPKEASLEVPAGSVEADVVLAGTDTVAIGPATLDLQEGTSTVVYAWGNEDDGYQLATQSITGLGGTPGSVSAGTAGLADTGLPSWTLGLLAAAGLGAVASATRLARTSRSRRAS